MSIGTATLPAAAPHSPTVPPSSRIRAEDFLKMDLGDGLHELVDGEIIEMPPACRKLGLVCLNAGSIFRDYGRRTGHGYAMSNDTVVVIDEYNVRGADVQYYSEARWPKSQDGDDLPPVPPDLVVEVISPTDRMAKVLKKVAAYLEVGVFVVLVLNPEDRTVAIYRGDTMNPNVLHESDTVENLPELPGFRCVVSDFFA